MFKSERKIMAKIICFSLLIFPKFVLAQYNVPITGSAPTATNPTGSPGLPVGTPEGILVGIMNWLLLIIGVIGVIAFVIAGILYLTSAGDDSKAKTAKQAMLYAIIGMIVALMGYVVIQAVDSMLNEVPLF